MCACRRPSLGFGKLSDGHEVTVMANNKWLCVLKCSAPIYLSDVPSVLIEMYA